MSYESGLQAGQCQHSKVIDEWRLRAERTELAIVDIRDKAALIANYAPEELERGRARQIILLCEKALAPFNP